MAQPRLLIGQRLREARRRTNLTQAALAASIGISPSYLNLIENDKRQIGGALLHRLADALGIQAETLGGAEDQRLAQDLAEVARTLSLPGLRADAAGEFVARSPEWARAFLGLHRAYRDAVSLSTALSDRLSQDPALMELSHAVLSRVTAIRSFAEILEQDEALSGPERARFAGIVAMQSEDLAASAREMVALLGNPLDAAKPTSPGEEVDDFIIAHNNHFPALEEAASDLRVLLDRAGGDVTGAIARRVGDTPAPAPGEPPASQRFTLARHWVGSELAGEIDALVDDPRLESDEARERARTALVSYAAAALLMPYAPFRQAAEETRYDLDLLMQRFDASLEQVAHRLVTLRRPGAEGLAFAFLRADPAGNLSKPFSAVPGLRMPRFGGSCPLWALHAAFATPDRPVVQLAVMPGGERYLFVARRAVKRRGGFGTPPVAYAIMLGCDFAEAERIVYGDGLIAGRSSLETPVGVHCRACPREACGQRAHAAIGLAPRPQDAVP